MAGLWRYDPDTPGGCKYLVKRRDGTIPDWPHFVLGARDPAAPWAIRLYALVSLVLLRDWRYFRDCWRMARDFDDYRRRHGNGDPNAPRHRHDDPLTVVEMISGRPILSGPVLAKLVLKDRVGKLLEGEPPLSAMKARDNFTNASGDARCQACCLPLMFHPIDPGATPLVVDCDGRRFKT